MEHDQQTIEKFSELINEELKGLENIEDKNERLKKLNTLYKIHKFLKYFDELEPIIDKYLLKKSEKDKYGDR